MSSIFQFLLIFQIYTVQWLNCKNNKVKLNFSYNCGGDAYILQSVAIHFKHTVFKSEHVCPSTKQMKYILRCWFLKVVQCSKELKIKINQVSFLCDVGDFATLVLNRIWLFIAYWNAIKLNTTIILWEEFRCMHQWE